MKKNVLIAALRVAVILFSLESAASAQVTTAAIVGTIVDSSGAALPGATVTARNVDTGFNRTVPSNEDGTYRLEFLPIGRYVVEVSLSGFKTATRSGIVLNVNDTARVDASLSVGAVAETVTVEGASPNVNTTTSEISKTIDAAAIQSLPIVDRNVYSLLDLTPGVQSNNNGIASASSGTNSLILGFPEQRTLINGGADGGTGSVNYYLDGGVNMTGLRNTGNILPNPDAIQEFKVQTNSYNAEYGRFASGVINVITKGRHQRLSRVGVRVSARRADERERVGLRAGHAAAQAQPVRWHRRRSDRARQDLLLRHLFGAASDDQHVPEHRPRADRAGANR